MKDSSTDRQGADPRARLGERLRRILQGRPRDLRDPRTYHQISLIAFLAWVGLGADGLSSSSYGPEESFKALGEAHYLALGLAAATAVTVFIISYAYSKIIEHFPFGGGGYVVASQLLGARVGVVSGSALLVDYVLTITTSVAAGAEATFSFLPPAWQPLKLPVEFGAIGLLTLLNLRGVRESVTALMPIFILFLITHAVLLLGVVLQRAWELPQVLRDSHQGLKEGLAAMGLGGVAGLFLRAYSMGAGTYTGIEAVSNGLQIMREPKVETGKRTMVYMALSLALVAGGVTLGYLLVHASPVPGKTMNAVLAESFARSLGGAGKAFVVATLFAETALLFVAAQTGFLDGPRVMANMANDGWLPHRFGNLSSRLVTKDGVVLMSGASALTLLYTGGHVGTLVLMYAINVFLTFSLSQLAMVRYWWRGRRTLAGWRQHISVHGVGLVLCASILVVNIVEKFAEGGWLTLTVTAALVVVCLAIREHYRRVQGNLSRLDEVMEALPPSSEAGVVKPVDPKQPAAVILVGGYGGLGVHALLTVQRLFPGHFKSFVFVSVGVVDAATMKGVDEVDRVREATHASLQRYEDLAHRLGLAATSRMAVGTEAVAEGERLCREIAREFPRAVFFAGKLIFQREGWLQRILHNETANQLQRRLQFAGINTMVLPVRVLTPARG
ncbi:MAG TPA: APC family permease [Myxococcales bacterium]|jgi:amino acid transporter